MAGARHGTSAPTLVDVARLAGVSRATASRAINGGSHVSAEVRRRVDEAVRELGYRPNAAARSLVTRRTDSIAVVIPESDQRLFTDPFFATILHGVTAELASTNLQIVLLIGHRGDGSRFLDYLRHGHTDGAIVVSHHHGDGVASTLAEIDMPSVLVGRPWSADNPVTYVDVDNHAGGVLAAERLIARGARRIGALAGPTDMGAAVDRLAGWRTTMEAAGLPTDAVVQTDWTAEASARAMAQMLAEHPDIDALFVASDLMASAALPVLARHGRRVPDDVAVVGFDDMELATRTTPPLTTVVNPAGEMARRSVAMLLEQLAGTGGSESVLLPTRLVVRESA